MKVSRHIYATIKDEKILSGLIEIIVHSHRNLSIQVQKIKFSTKYNLSVRLKEYIPQLKLYHVCVCILDKLFYEEFQKTHLIQHTYEDNINDQVVMNNFNFLMEYYDAKRSTMPTFNPCYRGFVDYEHGQFYFHFERPRNR